ncbi:hypothetical protein [Mycobacteroides abscessus]|uniref:hypothetical protein n=1 Tax=Mycobacteroides abscessus TaxID=36809 RepID=UPI000926A630|nr:hypothetical protein [Mycobacteroides abscessus]SIM78818.1 Uncharacterised protein [Mycobacteroides abscessus subsp. abscessus]
MNATNQATCTALVASILLMPITACTAATPSKLTDSRALIKSCTGPINSYVAVDGTASGNTVTLDGPRRRAIDGELAEVAACGGRAKVVVFSSSSAATTTLFEGRIPLTGATDQAKARRLDAAVKDVGDQIETAFGTASSSLDAGGSDPVAQMRLFGEWTHQGGDGKFRLLMLTDGFQNIGVGTEQMVADPVAAAAVFPAPDLSGTDITIAGIGEIDGPAPATTVVDALKTFFSTLCQRSGATTCTVVTEIAKAMS